jgi:hypothetical protein
VFVARLPDGIFSNLNTLFWKISDGLAMEDVGIFYGHLVYLVAIWYILWLFGTTAIGPLPFGRKTFGQKMQK